MNVRKDYLKFISSLLLFGSNGIVAACITISTDGIVFWRTLIGAAFLAALCLATGRRFSCLRNKRDAAFIVASGLAMGASWVFLYEAYREVGIGISSIAYYCAPVIVMALSPVLFHERLTARKLIGFAAVLAGAVLINVQTLGVGGSAWGLFCGWMSALAHAAMVIFSKKADGADGLENSALQLVAAFLLVAGLMTLRQEFATAATPLGEWGWVLVLGLINTGVGCYWYFSSYGGLSVQTVAILGYLEPLSAVVLSALLLGETMTAAQILGAGLILAGALYGETADRLKARRAAA